MCNVYIVHVFIFFVSFHSFYPVPTPGKSHYTFNHRDLSKVFQGILMAPIQKIKVCVQIQTDAKTTFTCNQKQIVTLHYTKLNLYIIVM